MNLKRLSLSLILVIFSHAGLANGQFPANKSLNDWPIFSFGYKPGFFMERLFMVDLQGMLSKYVREYGEFHRWMPLQVTREQALAFKEYYDNKAAMLTPGWIATNEAIESGDRERIKAAMEKSQVAYDIVHEMGPIKFKEMVLEEFDADQLETIKSMCISVVMQQGFDQLLIRKRSTMLEHGLDRKALSELYQTMREAELEIQREILQLRRKAWDKVMAKLPPELVAQLEEELGFGGLEKPK